MMKDVDRRKVERLWRSPGEEEEEAGEDVQGQTGMVAGGAGSHVEGG